MKIVHTARLWRNHIHLLRKNDLIAPISNQSFHSQRSLHSNTDASVPVKITDSNGTKHPLNAVNLSTDINSVPPLVTACFKSNLKLRQTPLKLSPLISAAVFSKFYIPYKYQDSSENSINDTSFFQDSTLIDFFRFSPFLEGVNLEDDSISKSISECNNVKSICDILIKNKDDLNINEAGTAIAKFWNIVLTEEVYQDVSVCGVESARQLNSVLPYLLEILEEDYKLLDKAAVVNILGQLRSFGINTEHKTFRKLFQYVLDNREELSLESVTRLILFLTSPELNYSIKASFLPIIERFIDNCTNSENLNMINYCIFSVKNLANNSLLRKHASKMIELMDSCSLNIIQPNNIFNFIKFHQFPDNLGYSEALEKVGIQLANRSTPFSWAELAELKIFCRSCKMNRTLQQKLHQQSIKSLNHVHLPNMKAELYLCLNPKVFNENKFELENLLREIMNSNTYLFHMQTVYYALKLSGPSDFTLVDDFWNKSLVSVLQEYKETDSCVKRESVLGEVFIRYLHFSHNLGGSYRNYNLEYQLIEILNEEMSHISGIITNRFSRMASFVIAYSHPEKISKELINKLESFRDQLDIEDISTLNQGLQLSISLNYRCRRKSYATSIIAITHLLLEPTKQHFKKTNSLNKLVKLYRGALIYDQALNKFEGYRVSSLPTKDYVNAPNFNVGSIIRYDDYKRMHRGFDLNADGLLGSMLLFMGSKMDQLTPKLVNYLSTNITNSNMSSDKILDDMLQYVAHKSDTIGGDVVARLLFCCFCKGHNSSLPHSVFKKAAEVITEDITSLHGLVLLQACIALCHYDVLTAPLINLVFNVGFMDQLDVEIQNCSSKGTYPSRVRRMLMEFNRAICINHPDSGVPWFHGEYCRDKVSIDRQIDGVFKEEVEDCLLHLLGGGEDFINDDVFSPYYHHMNFEFVLDSEGAPVRNTSKKSKLPKLKVANVSTTPVGHTRYCIILINTSQYVSSIDRNGAPHLQLIGWTVLRIKQLESIGYTVITVPRHEWQSMALSTFSSKSKYLQNKIWSDRN